MIDIPEVVNISHDSCVAVDVLKNVGGTVKIYLDGKLICNKKYEDYFVFDLEKYLKFNLPVEAHVESHEEGPKLIPHPDNGKPRLPSSAKLISRLKGNGSSD